MLQQDGWGWILVLGLKQELCNTSKKKYLVIVHMEKVVTGAQMRSKYLCKNSFAFGPLCCVVLNVKQRNNFAEISLQ